MYLTLKRVVKNTKENIDLKNTKIKPTVRTVNIKPTIWFPKNNAFSPPSLRFSYHIFS